MMSSPVRSGHSFGIHAQAIDSGADPALSRIAAPHAQIATVSHELRTPLTAIRGALDLISSGTLGTLSEPAARMLAIARINSDRLLRLVDDILTSEALRDGQLPMCWDDIDLDDLLRDAIAANTPLCAEHPGRLRLLTSLPGASLRGDRGRLLQVLSNLLANAVKFDPTGAHITIALARRAGGYRITVADRGPGIPAAFRSQIFTRFARAAETAGQVQGSGLGLYITRAIVEQHGGTISYDCPARAGTRFHVHLPAANAPPQLAKIYPL